MRTLSHPTRMPSVALIASVFLASCPQAFAAAAPDLGPASHEAGSSLVDRGGLDGGSGRQAMPRQLVTDGGHVGNVEPHDFAQHVPLLMRRERGHPHGSEGLSTALADGASADAPTWGPPPADVQRPAVQTWPRGSSPAVPEAPRASADAVAPASPQPPRAVDARQAARHPQEPSAAGPAGPSWGPPPASVQQPAVRTWPSGSSPAVPEVPRATASSSTAPLRQQHASRHNPSQPRAAATATQSAVLKVPEHSAQNAMGRAVLAAPSQGPAIRETPMAEASAYAASSQGAQKKHTASDQDTTTFWPTRRRRTVPDEPNGYYDRGQDCIGRDVHSLKCSSYNGGMITQTEPECDTFEVNFSPQACADECDAISNCRGFTYRSDKRVCYFKSVGCSETHNNGWAFYQKEVCYLDEEECKHVAQAAGLIEGAGSQTFAGDYSATGFFKTTGCFTFESGPLAGHAFYGRLDGEDVRIKEELKPLANDEIYVTGYGCELGSLLQRKR